MHFHPFASDATEENVVVKEKYFIITLLSNFSQIHLIKSSKRLKKLITENKTIKEKKRKEERGTSGRCVKLGDNLNPQNFSNCFLSESS